MSRSTSSIPIDKSKRWVMFISLSRGFFKKEQKAFKPLRDFLNLFLGYNSRSGFKTASSMGFQEPID
jgi:hypothetical protein